MWYECLVSEVNTVHYIVHVHRIQNSSMCICIRTFILTFSLPPWSCPPFLQAKISPLPPRSPPLSPPCPPRFSSRSSPTSPPATYAISPRATLPFVQWPLMGPCGNISTPFAGPMECFTSSSPPGGSLAMMPTWRTVW